MYNLLQLVTTCYNLLQTVMIDVTTHLWDDGLFTVLLDRHEHIFPSPILTVIFQSWNRHVEIINVNWNPPLSPMVTDMQRNFWNFNIQKGLHFQSSFLQYNKLVGLHAS